MTSTQERRGTPVTHDQARESARRLINSHFGNAERARASIPAHPDDDDLIVCDYIAEQRARDERIAHLESALVINRHDLTILHELAKTAHAAMEDSCADDFSLEKIDYERLSEALDVYDQRWPDAMVTLTSDIVDAMLPVGEAQR